MALTESERETWGIIGVVGLVLLGWWFFSTVFGANDSVQPAGAQDPDQAIVSGADDCVKDRRFCGDLVSTYESAYGGCGAFSPAELKLQLGAVSTNAADIGEAFASSYGGFAYQAAFEGCVDGVLSGS